MKENKTRPEDKVGRSNIHPSISWMATDKLGQYNRHSRIEQLPKLTLLTATPASNCSPNWPSSPMSDDEKNEVPPNHLIRRMTCLAQQSKRAIQKAACEELLGSKPLEPGLPRKRGWSDYFYRQRIVIRGDDIRCSARKALDCLRKV